MAHQLTNNTTALEELLTKARALPEAGNSVDNPELLTDLNATNGGTAATTIAGAVDNTEALTSSQTDLIAQIASALEGKATSGGSSSGSALEIGTLTGATTMGVVAEPGVTTFYYDLENIPHISEKKLVLIYDASKIYYIILSRSSTSDGFTAIFQGGTGSISRSLAIDGYVLSVSINTSGSFSTATYYAC